MAQTAATVQTADPWPQATSDLPADPAVRFGLLPNGMKYAILRNATPPGQASLRLRSDAGSLMENDDQQGLAHFIRNFKHMESDAMLDHIVQLVENKAAEIEAEASDAGQSSNAPTEVLPGGVMPGAALTGAAVSDVLDSTPREAAE